MGYDESKLVCSTIIFCVRTLETEVRTIKLTGREGGERKEEGGSERRRESERGGGGREGEKKEGRGVLL